MKDDLFLIEIKMCELHHLLISIEQRIKVFLHQIRITIYNIIEN